MLIESRTKRIEPDVQKQALVGRLIAYTRQQLEATDYLPNVFEEFQTTGIKEFPSHEYRIAYLLEVAGDMPISLNGEEYHLSTKTIQFSDHEKIASWEVFSSIQDPYARKLLASCLYHNARFMIGNTVSSAPQTFDYEKQRLRQLFLPETGTIEGVTLEQVLEKILFGEIMPIDELKEAQSSGPSSLTEDYALAQIVIAEMSLRKAYTDILSLARSLEINTDDATVPLPRRRTVD